MLHDINIPEEVLVSIQAHLDKAVRRVESHHRNMRPEEDAITGALVISLLTDSPQFVEVTSGYRPGVWRWEISSAKLGSKGRTLAPESVVGADGVIEVSVGEVDVVQRKSALFQAKNSTGDDRLIDQCAHLSNWREAAFVIAYTESGYFAYQLDDCVASGGSLAVIEERVPLATWLVDMFLRCRVGSRDVYYDHEFERLYWVPSGGENAHSRDAAVYADFLPKHVVRMEIRPPNWRWAAATKIGRREVSEKRLRYTPRELFGFGDTFSVAELRKRRKKLQRAYHSDANAQLSSTATRHLDRRFSEITDAAKALELEVRAHTDDASTPDIVTPLGPAQEPSRVEMPQSSEKVRRNPRPGKE